MLANLGAMGAWDQRREGTCAVLLLSYATAIMSDCFLGLQMGSLSKPAKLMLQLLANQLLQRSRKDSFQRRSVRISLAVCP
jgi:hypothetical protein